LRGSGLLLEPHVQHLQEMAQVAADGEVGPDQRFFQFGGSMSTWILKARGANACQL
jgi:hypothetical protein